MSAPYDLYIALEGNLYTQISGVTSETATDVDYYDGSLMDLSISAAFAGGTQDVLGSNYTVVANVPTPGVNALANVSSAVNLASIPAADKVAPTPQLKKRSRYEWQADGGLYWAWSDQIRCVSRTPFGFAGGIIPATYVP